MDVAGLASPAIGLVIAFKMVSTNTLLYSLVNRSECAFLLSSNGLLAALDAFMNVTRR